MSTIGSNIAALKSLHNLRLNEDGFAEATERLSSGKRLNAAGDDAAGAAIVNRMTSQIILKSIEFIITNQANFGCNSSALFSFFPCKG